MSDFDYEELDRAVSSVGAPSEPPVVTPPQPSAATPVTTAPDTPAARRSSGRFMDVVHPSSDMRAKVSERAELRVDERPSMQPDRPDVSPFTVADETPVEKPLESPFLSDAQVEKQPLGAMPPVGVQEQPPQFEPSQATSEVESPIEEVEEATFTPEAPASGLEASEPEASEPAAPVAEEVMPSSTPFVEQPVAAKTPQESGAIYDTETYHQPVAQAAKKTSGGLVALWISLLVIVGAAAGAAVYFFVLQ